jgi:acetylglutamate kinase
MKNNMKDVGQRAAEMGSLKHASPYIRLFKGKTFVLKVGGAAVETEPAIRRLLEQVEILHHVGIRVVLVHGGGSESSALTRSLGASPRFVEGRRVTDETDLAVAAMVLNGSVNTRILAVCRALGLPAVGISGVDAGLIQARRRPPVRVGAEMVDYGFVGDIAGVVPGVLEKLLDAGLIPIVSPLSAADDGTLLNINADTVASALAVGLQAEKLMLLTGGQAGAGGVLENPDDPGSLVSYTDLSGLRRLQEQGCLVKGMLPKASAIESALLGGVRRVHILSAEQPDNLLAEVFTNQGVGTLVVADVHVLSPAERIAK